MALALGDDDPGIPLSSISPLAYIRQGTCGYCDSENKGNSYYARSTSIDATLYQKLVDRCWRRSGTCFYKPNQRDACCPHYTIRLDASQFRPSKDQRQVVNKFNKFALGNEYIGAAARLYPRSRNEAHRRDSVFDLVERIHECETPLLKQPPSPAHEFIVTLEFDGFTEEKYKLYVNYQNVVHKEGPERTSRSGFKRFLCNSPITRTIYRAPDGQTRQVGTYHHCYRLDGKLVAMGVLDLLPDCVSSVYFVYHESINHWRPGKLGALHEIALAKEMGYGWWYPGFYIHNCQKMKYKLDYSPQFMLDPDSLDFIPATKEVMGSFNERGYLDLSRQNSEAKNDRELPTDDGGNGEVDSELRSLFDSNMPGVPTIEQMRSINLDNIPIRIPTGIFKTSDIVRWDTQNISNQYSLAGQVAQLVAAMGPDLLGEYCLDYESSRREGNEDEGSDD